MVEKLLDEYNSGQSEESSLGIVWITDGKVQVEEMQPLKHIIFKAMAGIVQRDFLPGRPQEPDGKVYQQCGISFVRIGDKKKADCLFKHLDDELRDEFGTYLAYGPDGNRQLTCNVLYKERDDREKFYKQCLYIVDYVKLNTTEEVESKAEKILFGALDPDLDQKE